jgi:muramoyltetrapeptide carboxypeptidase
MDIQFPPFLQKGDKVVIVSPSSKIDQQFLKGAKKRMESWGLKVAIGKHAGSSSGRYAGTIKQRLKDLQDAMDDPKVKAILCSRGGYGAVHLIDKIDFTAFHEHPKWLLGFSDITALHNLFQKNGYASLHSLMARHLTVEPEDDLCTNYLKDILFGNIPSYTCEKHKLNKQGTAQGVLHGGNMAVKA